MASLHQDDIHTFVTGPADAGKRLDAFLRERLSHLSRRRICKLIDEGLVSIGGLRADKGTRLRGGEEISLPADWARITSLRPDPGLPVRVVYEDSYIVVVDKPAGLATVALQPTEQHTVANFLLARYPEMASLSPAGLEAGLVNRLDRETSGLLLAARTPLAHNFLRDEFRAQRVRKGYWALVYGNVSRGGTIALKLCHDPGNRGKMRISATGKSGREAVTHYRPTERFADCTLLWVEIRTGVMHQIRAHLSALGHRIVGDSLYGDARQPLPRLFLHAAVLEFRHPNTLQSVELGAPLPPDLEAFLATLRGKKECLIRS